jgi:hypothetical protein
MTKTENKHPLSQTLSLSVEWLLKLPQSIPSIDCILLKVTGV